jgi:hypothetical protein
MQQEVSSRMVTLLIILEFGNTGASTSDQYKKTIRYMKYCGMVMKL